MNKLLVLFFIGLVVCIPQNEERDLEATGSDTDITTTPSGTVVPPTTEPPDVTTTPVVTTTTTIPEVTTPQSTGTEEEMESCKHLVVDKDWMLIVNEKNNRTAAISRDNKKLGAYKGRLYQEISVNETDIVSYDNQAVFTYVDEDVEEWGKILKNYKARELVNKQYMKNNLKVEDDIDSLFAIDVTFEDVQRVNQTEKSEDILCYHYTTGTYDAAYGVVPAFVTLFLIFIVLL